ncbi:MAG: S9 family peptidase [bacterium]|nr:S9 family peptidase [bacterium]
MSKTLLPCAVLMLVFCLAAVACRQAGPAQAPRATVKPHTLEIHDHTRVDDYYWLKERENPEVINYLEAENTYTDAVMSHTRALQEELFNEIVGRIKKNDESVPYFDNGYYYYDRFEEGGEYPIYCRREGSMDGDEEIILNANQRADGQPYYAARGLEVSSGNDILAFSEDTAGRRIYTLRFKSLTSGEMLADTIPEVTGNIAWAEDNRTIFYSKQDLETLRSHLVFRHVLGTDSADDVLVWDETDETFSCWISKTKSKRFVMIGSNSTLSDEIRFIEAGDPTGEFNVFLPRERGHEYSIDHFGDRFFIRTNHEATNFKLMSTPIDRTALSNWAEVIEHRDEVYLSSFDVFKNYLVVSERKAGLIQLRIRPWSGENEHYLDFGEATYDAWIDANLELDTELLRYGYSSLTTPESVYDYDMSSRERTLMKQDEVLGGFDPSNYVAERLYATAGDGVQVPISLVYRPDARSDGGPSPLLLYGYGSYGASMDPYFRSDRLSLLDRGFIYAIAHIRGGQENGRQWYEDGRLLNKKNTFTDFVDCGDFLVEQGYTTVNELFAMGGSAGGLLMGAVVNMRPDLFQAAVARVPFVDVITTMLDPDIPLTTAEYDEWGNPNDKKYYDYMLSYSPYDQIEAKNYPALLITAGLHDSQVQYWEPAKWTAKLRAVKTDDNLLLLHTNMEAGHGGASGRFRRYRETALTYAFLLDQIGMT